MAGGARIGARGAVRNPSGSREARGGAGSRAHARGIPSGRPRPTTDLGAHTLSREPRRCSRLERISLRRIPSPRPALGAGRLRLPARLPGSGDVSEPYCPVPGAALPRMRRVPRSGDPRSPRLGRRGGNGALGANLRGRKAVSGGPLAMKKERRPIVISHVLPTVDDGRYPVKREVGDRLMVTADIFKEGHDLLAAAIRYRAQDQPHWQEAPLRLVDNDGWAGSIPLDANTRYWFTIEAWTDRFGSWVDDVTRRAEGGQANLTSELLEGARLVEQARPRAAGTEADLLDGVLARAGAEPQNPPLRALVPPAGRQAVRRPPG